MDVYCHRLEVLSTFNYNLSIAVSLTLLPSCIMLLVVACLEGERITHPSILGVYYE